MTTVKIKVLADASDAKKGFTEVETSAGGMSDAVTGIFAGLGSQLGSVFGGIGEQLNAALDVGKSRSKLAAQLGLNAEDAAKYGKVASDLYAGAWGESLDDVNNTIATVTQNIGQGSDEWLKKTSALTLDFATTFDQDAQSVTKAIATMLNTGIAQSSEEAFDILTAGMQQGANKADDLLDTFTEYPTLFRELGLNGQAAMGLITQSLQAGARDSDFVADALKEFSIRAKDGSTTTAEGFKAIGLSAEEMGWMVANGGESSFNALDQTLAALRAIEDPVKRDAAAVQLFGTKAEDLGDALFAMDPDNAADQIGNVTGAAQKMSDTLNDNAATTLESYKRQALMGIANILVNNVIPAFQQIKDVIISVGGFFEEHRGIAIALGVGIASVVVPALIGMAVSAGAAAISMIALAAPIIASIAAVAALAAGVIYAYEHWGWFRAAVDAVASFITGTLWPILKAIGSWIINDLVPTIKVIGTTIGNIAVDIYNFFEGIISFIWGLPGRIAGAAANMWNGIVDSFKWAINQIIGLWNRFDLGIPGVSLPGWMGGGSWGGIGDLIPDIPYLDTGGISMRQQLAMIHPNEAVLPLPDDWRRNGLGAGGGDTYIFHVNAMDVNRSTASKLRNAVDRAGRNSRSVRAAR